VVIDPLVTSRSQKACSSAHFAIIFCAQGISDTEGEGDTEAVLLLLLLLLLLRN